MQRVPVKIRGARVLATVVPRTCHRFPRRDDALLLPRRDAWRGREPRRGNTAPLAALLLRDVLVQEHYGAVTAQGGGAWHDASVHGACMASAV